MEVKNKMDKQIRYKALDMKVLVVAVEGAVKDWACYIGAVKGENHEREFMQVAQHGTKISEKMATMLFPDFANKFTWRR